jgi:hypothetical protein
MLTCDHLAGLQLQLDVRFQLLQHQHLFDLKQRSRQGD